KKGGELVRIIDPKSKQTWELDTRKYQIGLADQPGGLTVPLDGGKSITLRREGKPLLTVSWTKPEAPRAAVQPKELFRLPRWGQGHLLNLEFSPDGTQLLMGRSDEHARLYDIASGELR